jgi:hypothetical protein
MRNAALVMGIACLGAIHGMAAEPEPAVTGIKPCVTLTGADSRVAERGYHRITSMNEWVDVWRKHKGSPEGGEYDHYYNPLGIPAIDFDRFMVIAVFQGAGMNSAGLDAVWLSPDEDRIVVRFDDKSYQTLGPDGGGKHVAVFGFFVLPRSSKPVLLEENVQRLIGKPPVWKERIAFPKI